MKKGLFVFILLSQVVFGQESDLWMHPNRGQWHENINYSLDLVGGKMYIEKAAFTYLFYSVGENHLKSHQDKSVTHNLNDSYKQHVLKATFLKANLNHAVKEEKRSSFYKNYFIGTDQSKWKSELYSFQEISYPNLYNGVDLKMETKGNKFKYSLIVQPGIEAAKEIQYKIEGFDKLEINKEGDLIIKHSFGKITESKPISWTIDKQGNKQTVKTKFHLKGNTISFSFPEGYDKSCLLVIDPQISFSTYTGSTADNWGCTATPDPLGNLYAGGTVFGAGYPTTTGAYQATFNNGDTNGAGQDAGGYDIGLSKFNANGTALLFSTYIGGAGNESPNSMVSDANGNLYVMGVTSSSDFTNLAIGYDNIFNGGTTIQVASDQLFKGTDIFVLKINSSGTSIANSTYIGGSGNDGLNEGNNGSLGNLAVNYGDNFRGEIILDANNNVYVASSTNSSNFPLVKNSQSTLKGTQDAVVFKLDANLQNLLWSTYFGGDLLETGNALQLNSSGDIFLTGGSNSSNVSFGPTSSTFNGGVSDGYIIRFNPNTGQLLGGRYIGTSDYDQVYFVQIDLNDNVYVYGQSFGAMAISPGLYGNANAYQFIRKFNPDLTSIIWNTKIGANSEEISPTAFLVSNCFEIYISGWGGTILGSNISSFETTPNAFQTSSNGDAFYIAVYDADMANLQYATFMGGQAQEHVDGGTSRFDKQGKIYHAVCSACTGLPNGFVSTPGVYSPNNGSPNCNLAAFKFELNSLDAIFAAPNFTICIPNPIQFFNNSVEGDVYFWDFGDGTSSNLENPTHNYTTLGEFTVKFVISDSQGCKTSDSTTFLVYVGSFDFGEVTPPPTICKGAPYQFDASGGINYVWSPANFLDDAFISNPTATIFQNTRFSVIVSDTCGVDTVYVDLNVFSDSIFVSSDTSVCFPNATQISVGGDAVSQIWSPNTFIDDNTSNNPRANPDISKYYYVNATTVNSCNYTDSVYIDVVYDRPVPNLIDSLISCSGGTYNLAVSGADSYFWYPNIAIDTVFGPNVTINPSTNMIYYCDFTNICGTETGNVVVSVSKPNVLVSGDTIMCYGDVITLQASGANSYVWSPNKGLSANTGNSVLASPGQNTNYTVIGFDQYSCSDTAFVSVKLFPISHVNAGANIIAEIGQLVFLNAISAVPGNYVWLPTNFLSCSNCQSTIANPNKNFSYTVYFTDTNGCRSNDVVTINYKATVYIPNTFTPDGSKYNEVFRVYGEGLTSFELLIFDRWGEIISTLTSLDDYWDGTYKGNNCQDGTYTWKLTYRDITNDIIVLTGHVNLLR